MEGLIPPRPRPLCRVEDLADGAARGFPPAPGGFTGLFAVRQGDDMFVYVNSCPHIGTPLDWTPDRFLSARRQPYHLRHAWCRVPHRRRGVRAGAVLRRSTGARHDPDQGRGHLRARGCRPLTPPAGQRSPAKRLPGNGRKRVDVRGPSRRRTGLSGQARDRREGARQRRALPRRCYERAARDPDGFWGEQAKRIAWMKPPTKIKNTSFAGDVSIKWFEDGTLNASVSCLDRHLANAADQTAIIWEGDDPGAAEHVTYRELHEQVCRLANAHEVARRQEGRPGDDLSADGAGGGGRDARLRADRRDPFRGVRRLLARQPGQPHPGLRVSSC